MKKFFLLILLLLSLTVNAQVINSITSNRLSFGFFDKNMSSTNVSAKVSKVFMSVPQLSKIMKITTAGTLGNVLTSSEKSSITDLIISGTINAHDFQIMRDSMMNLKTLDISGVNIAPYSGSDGTSKSSYSSYPANEIPSYAFYTIADAPGLWKNQLKSIVLPNTLTSIGDVAFAFSSLTSISISAAIKNIGFVAFSGCDAQINVDTSNSYYSSVNGVLYNKSQSKLIQCPSSVSGSFTVPSTVDSIGIYSFFFCDKLSAINLSSSVLSIGDFAFTSCSGLFNVDATNIHYVSQDGVLYNKSKTKLIQCPTSVIGTFVIPTTVDSINNNSFYYCSLLTSISLPSTLNYIGNSSFYNCSNLSSITVNSLPISLSSTYNVFSGVNLGSCVLNVPFGSKSLFQSSIVWSSFVNIVENPHGLNLGTNKLILSSLLGSKGNIAINSNDDWTASSNQNWLTLSKFSGSGNDTIECVATLNNTTENRTTLITVTVSGLQPQTITITQAGLPKVYNLTPGGLATAMPSTDLASILNLKITGTIDARDFRTMRDNMPKLSFLDLSEVSISAYNGIGGPLYLSTFSYPANTVPLNSFYLGSGSENNTLAAVLLPQTLTAIGINAFHSCKSISEILIPESVGVIGDGSFGSCTLLQKVILPSHLKTIENNSFTACGFSTIIIPTSVKSIGTYGFGFCKNLRSVLISDSVTNISSSAFEGCSFLSSLTIGNSVSSIGNSAFKDCTSLTTVIIPNSVINLDGFAFASCSNLQKATLPNSIPTIGYYCFSNCSNLTDISIPASVKKIDYSAFEYCTRLTNLIIPSTVNSIGNDAFSNCMGLKSITVNTDNPIDLTSSSRVFLGVDFTNCALNVPFGAKTVYSNAIQWKDFINIIQNIHGFNVSKDSVKLLSADGSKAEILITSNDQWTTNSNQTWLKLTPAIGMGNDTLRMSADVNLSSLQRIAIITLSSGAITKTVTVVQGASPKILNIVAGGLGNALTADELSSITDLTIAGTIDARDFKTLRDNMPKLENLDISVAKVVAYVGNTGTAGNYSCTYAEKVIPQYAFCNSSTYVGKVILNTINLPKNTTAIVDNAFQSCTGLNNIIIPDSVVSIGSSAFQGCSGLTNITIPNSVTTIGSSAFQRCSGLSSIIIPNSVVKMSNYTFQYCTGLISVFISNTLTDMDWFVFSDCTKLQHVTLGNSLLNVGYGVFQNCTSLTEVIMGASIKTIDSNVSSFIRLLM